jgi:glycosyltransferase involved in cell wall biosynthesis
MDRPSFSIIVPTYQRSEMVCEALQALSRIDYPGEVEVIVVIDGSTDGTAAAIAELNSRLGIHVIEQENRGAGAARNLGAANANGEILLFIDDDMICERDVLEQHASNYAQGADAVLGDCPLVPEFHPGLFSGIVGQGQYRATVLPLTPFDVFSGHISVRRTVFEELGGFDESFTAGGKYGNEDIDFGLRLLRRHRIWHNPKAISRQRTVRPRGLFRRATKLANADLHFATKHPDFSTELFERRGASRISKATWLLSGIPIFPRIFAELVALTIDLGLRTTFRSNRHLARLLHVAYALTYWSEFRRRNGILR